MIICTRTHNKTTRSTTKVVYTTSLRKYMHTLMIYLIIVGQPFPDQLTDFNFTVEQDNRAGFYQHHIIHLEWELPQGKGSVFMCVLIVEPLGILWDTIYTSDVDCHYFDRIVIKLYFIMSILWLHSAIKV